MTTYRFIWEYSKTWQGKMTQETEVDTVYKKAKSIDFINFFRFIFSPENSEDMRADLRVDLCSESFLGRIKTVVWIILSVLSSLAITQLN